MTDSLPVIDGHNDTLLNLHEPSRGGGRSFFERSSVGHVDLPRARDGGLAAGFFAAFAPADPSVPRLPQDGLVIEEDGYTMPLPPRLPLPYARQTVCALAARLFRIERESRHQARVVRTASDLDDCLRDNTLGMIFHMEGAEAIDPFLDTLYVLHAAGLRSLGPVWSRANVFGEGVPFAFPQSPDTGSGLTDAGRQLVRACNSLGVIIDLSHMNEQGFWDVASLSTYPLVATHSNVHAICPVTRNLTDRQLDAIGESGGVVGITFDVSMIRRDGGLDRDTPLADIADHIDYVAQRIGIEHVALGSDFDGATMPLALGDVSDIPALLETLRMRGYDEVALRQVASENWRRVIERTWHSGSHSSSRP